ncbi:MAG: chemotaxis protein CheA, partial [Rhodospirillaceae bacterium]
PPSRVIPLPAPVARTDATTRNDRRAPTVRVDVHKLERLGNMVGELVIAQAVLQQQAAGIPDSERPGLFRAIKDMSQYIRDLQEIALAVRAQPLKEAFSRLIPVARELERSTGKKIKLVMSGDDTEIDKTVVDRLAEPLTHLLRNSVDHGIEPREDRIVNGKPAEGTVLLSARQVGSQVFITIEDDGIGICRDAVRNRAIERGLIDANAELSDSEIDNLIFLPGFSTAEQVTELSGRGVGMDVVRQTITDLGGQIIVESTPGRGSRFSLILPLSLAIVDVLVAVVGRQHYLLPVGNIIESVQPLPKQLLSVPGRGDFLHLRGSMLPIIVLADEFEVAGAVRDASRAILVVAELRRGQLAALQVDDVLGQEPVVVKSLERNYRKVPGIIAATILGDGRAALIVDYSSLGQAVPSARRQLAAASR